MAIDKLTSHAIQQGRRLAVDVLKHRATALRRRAASIKRVAVARAVRATRKIHPNIARALGGPGPAGVLVAEGDSWFDYPWHDVLSELEDAYGFEVESVAHKGDRVEEMAYSGGQLDEFTRLIDKLLRKGIVPRAILISGGGNDIAGDEFGMLLDNIASPTPGVNEAVAAAVVDGRIRNAYVTILTAVTRVCRARLQGPLPIVVHGYDYPVPDGRGFMGGWGPLPGPWLEPGFREKGFDRLPVRITEMKKLIERFNRMVAALPGIAGLEHVRYANLRGTLSTAADYKKSWANELHPTPGGFALVTAKIAARIP